MIKKSEPDHLAIDGGPKTRTDELPTRFLFGQAEKQAVMALFDQAIEQGSEALGYGGPQEQAYCETMSEMLGGGVADGVNSGTNALWVALRVLELEPFSEVIVPAVTDTGGVMPVPLCNCIPVPADCEPDSYNIGPEQIAARLTDRTAAIIVAHIAGIPADMDPIMALARDRGLPVIEDCAQAHGAVYKGRPAGSIGDLAIFSTMYGKHHATAGQGGLVFSRDPQKYAKIRHHVDRGKPYGMPEDWTGENLVAGLNCNMDELHAAIGLVQLKKLPDCVRKRRKLATAMEEGCQSLRTVRMIGDPPDCEASYWFQSFRLDLEALDVSRDRFVEALVAEGITIASGTYFVVPTRMAWHKNHAVFGTSRLPWSGRDADAGPPDYDLPNIEATDARSFKIFVHEDWTPREVEDTLAALAKLERAFLR